MAEIQPRGVACELFNDTLSLLWSGSPTGTGVAVVSGTGSNCYGRDARGVQHNIGGLAWKFGDGGGGSDLGTDVLRAAFRGRDGRGPATSLGARIEARFGLRQLDDVVDRFLADSTHRLTTGAFCPLAFEAAAAGDEVARDLLWRAGDELGLSATLVARRLFAPDERFDLVLGGSVLRTDVSTVLRDRLVERVRAEFGRATPVVPDGAPVAGSAIAAAACAGVADLSVFADRLRASLGGCATRDLSAAGTNVVVAEAAGKTKRGADAPATGGKI